MACEIERKFLVVDDSYRELSESITEIRQGYLMREPEAVVRVRVRGNHGYLTVKSKNHGASRGEWEYEVPVTDAMEMLSLCNPSTIIDKVRYQCGRWEVDEFHGRLAGLRVAEIELESEHEEFALPSFVGREVTGDARYYNSNLAAASEVPV